MSTAEAPSDDRVIEAYIDQLKTDLPDLDFGTLRKIGDGWDHEAIEIDGMVFRLPKSHKRNAKREAHVKYETRALALLAPKLNVAIPTPAYISPDYEFFGYAKLPGLIAYDVVRKMGPEKKRQHLHDWV